MAGMYGPNDALGAMGYERNGCFGVIVALFIIGAGTGLGLFFVL
jgi:hypothetical protein